MHKDEQYLSLQFSFHASMVVGSLAHFLVQVLIVDEHLDIVIAIGLQELKNGRQPIELSCCKHPFARK